MEQNEIDHLVKMANDIAANLSFQAGSDERIADHINRFWAPRMRRLLIKHAADNPGELSDTLLAAIKKVRR